MRVLVVVLLLGLQLPELAGAQLMPKPRAGGRSPAEPAELPPGTPEMELALAYRRLRVSVESYPLVSYVRAPGYGGDAPAAWASVGAGSRLDYRLNPFVSATLDITSSSAGAQVMTNSAELGARVRPEQGDDPGTDVRRTFPFVDLRVGYVATSQREQWTPDVRGDGSAVFIQHSNGFGVMAGLGMERILSRRFSVTTAAALLQSSMTISDFSGTPPHQFAMTTLRYTIGLRYTPVRLVLPSEDR